MDYKNTIVILMYNKWELTQRLLLGLLRHEYADIDEIVVVDNGSDKESKSSLWNFVKERAFSASCTIRIEEIEKNIGFTLGANYGLQKADDLSGNQIVYLFSNDVQVNGKFIRQAEGVFRDTKRALVGNRHIEWDTGWNNHGGIVFDYLEGYFLAATSDGWKELNYFDVNYAPFDMEDIDASTTAKQKGYKLVSLNNPYIIHKNGGTIGFNPEREKITIRNMEYFKRKWTG